MAEIEITPGMVRRSGHTGLSDPCIICGGKFGSEFGWPNTCPHTTDQTQAVLKRIKSMPKKTRDALRRKSNG